MGDTGLDELIEQAAEAIELLSSGASLCTLTRGGGRGTDVKWAEGRWAALREARRAADIESVMRAWQDHLATICARGGGDAWIAYRQGGVEALAQALTLSASPATGAKQA